MSAYTNIAVAGAAGDLGSAVFKSLIDSNKFNLTVLTRIGSKSTFPEGIKVIQVDYNSLDSLTSALQGQDAVVSTVGSLAIPSQTLLIDAAVATGVKRFLPSEFGSNLSIPSVRKLPLLRTKVDIEDKLVALANEGKISYTFVYSSAFLDWGLTHNLFIDFDKAEATLWDGGNTEFSTTTLASIGQAVVGVLTHPEETKDRAVYIHDTVLTQNKLLEIARELNPGKKWTVKEAKIDDATAASDAKIAQGIIDWPTLSAYLYRCLFDPASVPKYPKLDNELLGVKGVTDEQLKELINPLVQ
ncbi:Isoflavone reductase-like protein PCBER [Fusarium oxysporum f. sp. cubense]|uniref:Isoflavone reductase-like protein PCBER n=1 Tax=Fusarium oxysporum f. sp. cubense TaxID=61366 RepID=A0A559KUK1_FUSOC|nr:Isoflavone reductase-like protein PCBER [Fusarium oxysporum f. sp. cubense]